MEDVGSGRLSRVLLPVAVVISRGGLLSGLTSLDCLAFIGRAVSVVAGPTGHLLWWLLVEAAIGATVIRATGSNVALASNQTMPVRRWDLCPSRLGLRCVASCSAAVGDPDLLPEDGRTHQVCYGQVRLVCIGF